MSVDAATVRRIAQLARIKVTEEEVPVLAEELGAILQWVEMLKEIDVDDVAPMTSVVETVMKKRADAVSDGNIPSDITANSPASEDHFFMVPKVVE